MSSTSNKSIDDGRGCSSSLDFSVFHDLLKAAGGKPGWEEAGTAHHARVKIYILSHAAKMRRIGQSKKKIEWERKTCILGPS